MHSSDTRKHTQPAPCHPLLRVRLALRTLALALCFASYAAADLESRTLLLYNSANATSLAVRNLYRTAHPDVLEFDLNDPSLGGGAISRDAYLSKVREPLLGHLNSESAPNKEPLSSEVLIIATTRGTPARITGTNELSLASTYASVESELVLLQQDLETTPFGSSIPYHQGIVDNPYHGADGTSIKDFDRSNIQAPRDFWSNGFLNSHWIADGFTPGDMYLVCRVDAAGSTEEEAIENIRLLLARSSDLVWVPETTTALLDEFAGPSQIDATTFGSIGLPTDDFSTAAAQLSGLGVLTLHDETANFITGPELPAPSRPIVALGTYGENHDADGKSEDPPGTGTYLGTYTNFHPAAVFVAYESFNGNSIVNGAPRGGQAQALDFIAAGGSFTVAHVAEPFTFAVADMDLLIKNLHNGGLTFAEAAYTAIPGLSWQNTPVGDPLAKVLVRDLVPSDFNKDATVDGIDLSQLLGEWGPCDTSCAADTNSDGTVDGIDLGMLLGAWGPYGLPGRP